MITEFSVKPPPHLGDEKLPKIPVSNQSSGSKMVQVREVVVPFYALKRSDKIGFPQHES
jgi:hypothetical protein